MGKNSWECFIESVLLYKDFRLYNKIYINTVFGPRSVSLGPRPPHRLGKVRGCRRGRGVVEQRAALTVEPDPVAQVRVGEAVPAAMTSHKWRNLGRGVSASRGQCCVRVSGGRVVPVGLGGHTGFLLVLGLGGDEVTDPQQTGPHAVVVRVLVLARAGLIPGHDVIIRLQELDHTLQDFCLLHLRVLQFLNWKKKNTIPDELNRPLHFTLTRRTDTSHQGAQHPYLVSGALQHQKS